jgi:predicted enzyme related to lactoylglutathione lyase
VERGIEEEHTVKVIEIAFVSYPVTDLKRARGFYEGTLGLRKTSIFGNEEKGFIEYDIGAGTLGIGNGVPEWKPSPDGGCAALEVEDFDAAIKRLKEDGVTIVRAPIETPVCYIAVISDPDGNSILIHKRKPGNP